LTNYATFSRTGILNYWDGSNYKLRLGWVVVQAAAKGPIAGDAGPEPYWAKEALNGTVGYTEKQPNNYYYRLPFTGDSTGVSSTIGVGTWAPAQSINLQRAHVIITDASKYE
jgi:hypothetical protein